MSDFKAGDTCYYQLIVQQWRRGGNGHAVYYKSKYISPKGQYSAEIDCENESGKVHRITVREEKLFKEKPESSEVRK